MATYDFTARSKENVSLPVGMNITNHRVYFKYSDSTTMRDSIEFEITPVVMDGKNIKFQLPLFNSTIYYQLYSNRLGRIYMQQQGQILNAPGGPAQEYVRTVNNTEPDSNGNVNVAGGPGGSNVTFTVDPTNPGVLIINY